MKEPLEILGESLQRQIQVLKLKQSAIFITLDIVVGLVCEITKNKKFLVSKSVKDKHAQLKLDLKKVDQEIEDLENR